MPEFSFRQTSCLQIRETRLFAARSFAAVSRPAPYLALAALLAATACSDPAGLREAKRSADTTGITEPTTAPVLLPIGPLLERADATTLSDATADQLEAQGAALRAQAAAIRSDAQAVPQTAPQTDPQTDPQTAPQTTP